MLKDEAAVKVVKLFALAKDNSNPNEAQCADKLARRIMRMYDLNIDDLPSLKQKHPARVVRNLETLLRAIRRCKMWLLLVAKEEELAIDMVAWEYKLENAIAFLKTPKKRAAPVRDVKKGDMVAMQRRYL